VHRPGCKWTPMGEASQRPSDLSRVARVDEVEGLDFLKNEGVTYVTGQ